jgi:hypothetical protein
LAIGFFGGAPLWLCLAAWAEERMQRRSLQRSADALAERDAACSSPVLAQDWRGVSRLTQIRRG